MQRDKEQITIKILKEINKTQNTESSYSNDICNAVGSMMLYCCIWEVGLEKTINIL